jgi:hypothetical protein
VNRLRANYIFQLVERGADHRFEKAFLGAERVLFVMDKSSNAVHTGFRTALLLGAAARTAAAAVLDGIDACEDLSHRGFLIGTARSTIRRRMKSAHALDGLDLLPPELRRLFLLQPLSRDCFVLRILVGLSPEVCVEILDVSNTEFEDAVCAALNQLPLLSSSTV